MRHILHRFLATIAGMCVALSVLASAPSPSYAQAAPDDRLTADETLQPGELIRTPDAQFVLVMQTDGNAVLYGSEGHLWATHTSVPGSRLTMQGDGNLVVRTPSDQVTYASHTAGNPGASVVLQGDGNLVMTGGIWQTGTWVPDPVLDTGETLEPGRALVSTDKRNRLEMQTDGNLVLYKANGTRPLVSNTFVPGSRLTMQQDGRLVLYAPNGSPLWHRGDAGAGHTLMMQNDGNLVMYRQGTIVWQSYSYDRHTILAPGNSLAPGTGLESGNSLYRMYMQTDGNLVLYGPAGVKWQSDTHMAGSRVDMRTDGNLVMFGPDGSLRWARGQAVAGSMFHLQDDGNAVIYSPTGAPQWSTYQPPVSSLVNPYGASTVDKGWTQRATWIMNQLKRVHPAVTSCGGPATGSDTGHIDGSYHYSGNGLDCYVGRSGVKPNATDKAEGDAAAAWLVANAEGLKVQQVIWYRQIWSWRTKTWNDYGDHGSITLDHYDHIHISVAKPGDGR